MHELSMEVHSHPSDPLLILIQAANGFEFVCEGLRFLELLLFYAISNIQTIRVVRGASQRLEHSTFYAILNIQKSKINLALKFQIIFKMS